MNRAQVVVCKLVSVKPLCRLPNARIEWRLRCWGRVSHHCRPLATSYPGLLPPGQAESRREKNYDRCPPCEPRCCRSGMGQHRPTPSVRGCLTLLGNPAIKSATADIVARNRLALPGQADL